MKKLLALIFVASLGLAVVGCKGSSDDSSTDSAPKTGIKDKTPKTGGDD